MRYRKGTIPPKRSPEALGREVKEVTRILEGMADKGLCTAGSLGDATFYGAPTFVPGIFEFQFMRGTSTERDRKIARLIHAYKAAVDAAQGPVRLTYPVTRVIPVNEKIQADSTVHTYDQMASYIEKSHPLSVSTCFCRHEAKLIDAADDCGNPDEVCMQFGMGAQFIIDRKMGRQISKEEALEILKKSEEAGLVHASINRQDIDFVCNCCPCHSIILKTALAQSKPGDILNSGFQPEHSGRTLHRMRGLHRSLSDRCAHDGRIGRMGIESGPLHRLRRLRDRMPVRGDSPGREGGGGAAARSTRRRFWRPSRQARREPV